MCDDPTLFFFRHLCDLPAAGRKRHAENDIAVRIDGNGVSFTPAFYNGAGECISGVVVGESERLEHIYGIGIPFVISVWFILAQFICKSIADVVI